MTQTYIRVAAMVMVMALMGCKDAMLGPTGDGSIAGQVVHAETGAPLPGVGITTTPPSNAIVTDEEGRFSFDELEAGSYQITARRAGFQQSTVNVAVRTGRTATATIFLQEQEEETNRAALDVEVLSFWNTTRNDTTFAEAEYRVTNTGEVTIEEFDVNFRIDTTAGARHHQESGERLRVGQNMVRSFRVQLQSGQATGVVVESVWTDPPLDEDG